MFRKFINREREIKFLEDARRAKGAKLIVIYGRRRVGKTEIIKEFVKSKDHIYFLADKRGTFENAKRLAAESAMHFNDVAPDVKNFDDVFRYIIKRSKNLIVAIDEFSYLIERDSDLTSVFQLIWDEYVSKTKIFLILSGSSISMMEQGTLSYKSPLYGRRTGQWKVLPLKFIDILKFFPNTDTEKVIEINSILGNIPAYLAKFEKNLSMIENIKKNILQKGTFLNEETNIILKEELREPSTYQAILEAIAYGATKISEMAVKSNIEAKDINKYITTLKKLDLIERLQPVTEKKTKKSIYVLLDNFFLFWYRYVYPYRSFLEESNYTPIIRNIEKTFNQHVGLCFERLCKEFVYDILPFSPTKVGKWWGHYRDKDNKRKEIEIDIVALNENTREIFFAECKWQDNINAEKVLEGLKEKAKYVQWNNGKRKEHYAVFAKSFIKKKEECFGLKDLERLFKR